MMALITGGSGSGKSEYGENLAVRLASQKEDSRLIYIATMTPFDEECEKKIARHRCMRADKGFYTVERYVNLKELEIPAYSTVILECMSNLLANELYKENGSGRQCFEAIRQGIMQLKCQACNLIVITNEVFSDGGIFDPETMFYIERLGALNCWMAEEADMAVEVVYSIPIIHRKPKEWSCL